MTDHDVPVAPVASTGPLGPLGPLSLLEPFASLEPLAHFGSFGLTMGALGGSSTANAAAAGAEVVRATSSLILPLDVHASSFPRSLDRGWSRKRKMDAFSIAIFDHNITPGRGGGGGGLFKID